MAFLMIMSMAVWWVKKRLEASYCMVACVLADRSCVSDGRVGQMLSRSVYVPLAITARGLPMSARALSFGWGMEGNRSKLGRDMLTIE